MVIVRYVKVELNYLFGILIDVIVKMCYIGVICKKSCM